GHIGFNESGSLPNSKTRLVTLDHITRVAASKDFQGLYNTRKTPITIGIKQIMQAKQVILFAWAEGKSRIIKQAVNGPITKQGPPSYLQDHPNSIFIVDKGASSLLTGVNSPWIVEKVEWNPQMIKKAVVGLASKLEKPVLMLTEADYIENGMSDLL